MEDICVDYITQKAILKMDCIYTYIANNGTNITHTLTTPELRDWCYFILHPNQGIVIDKMPQLIVHQIASNDYSQFLANTTITAVGLGIGIGLVGAAVYYNYKKNTNGVGIPDSLNRVADQLAVMNSKLEISTLNNKKAKKNKEFEK